MRIFRSSATKQITSSALDVGKSVAKEGAKKALEVGEKYRGRRGKEVSHKSVNPKIKENFTKTYTTHNTRH